MSDLLTGGATADRAPIDPTGLPVVQVEYADRVNFAMQQNGVPLVERLAIFNGDGAPLREVRVSVSLADGAAEEWSAAIDQIAAGSTFHLEPRDLRLRPGTLASRTEAERTELLVTTSANDQSATRSLPIDLLAFDEWPGMTVYPELLAAFVTPNHTKVAELLQGARQSLGELSGVDALDGYQSGSRLRAAQIAEACFNAVQARGIGYINPPASFERDGQRVRLVDRILRERFGSCLDLSLLLVSLWEQAGLHPLVLLVEGHAMPAVWTRESHLPEPAIDEPARLRNLIELGDVVPVESTLVTQQAASFAGAVEAAKRRMASPGSVFCAVDICSSRRRGVRPLPLRGEGDESSLDLDAVSAGAPVPAATVLDRVALADRADGVDRGARPAESGSEPIDRWKRQLLDLSLRNRLINFRETGKTVRLAVPHVARLEDVLASGSGLKINPKTDSGEPFLLQQLEAKHVYTDLTPLETEKRLLQLFRVARAGIEETGANLLHLALGMLRWYETSASQTPRFAPLILLPAQLHRRSTGSGYRYELSLSDEPLRPNVTLLEKLRAEFGIDTAGLAEMPEDESGLDVPLILRTFRSAILDTRWEVEESAFLGLFSFNKFLMWRDLQENLEGLRRNRLVQHLIDRNAGAFDPDPMPRPDDLDHEVPPGALFCTRDADSSQLAAVRAAADGRSFVLEGPPGTGKSQTIANIIADSLARGKRVLFVAEKMAALSVVRKRLEDDGLGRFCLELHSAKASKKEVLAQLETALTAADPRPPGDWEQLCAELGATRQQLNAYVGELHRPRTSGETLYQVLGRLVALGDGPRIELPREAVAGTTAQQLAAWRRHVEQLSQRSESVDPPHKHPLRGIGREEWSFTLPDEARSALTRSSAAAAELRKRVTDLLEKTGADPAPILGRSGVQALAVAASMFQQCPLPGARLLGGEGRELIARLQPFLKLGRQRDERQRALQLRWRQEFVELDHLPHLDRVRRAMGHAMPVRLLTGFLARRSLRAYALETVPGLPVVLSDLELAREVKQATQTLDGSSSAGEAFGSRWNNGERDWQALDAVLTWSEQFHKVAEVLQREASGRAIVQQLIRTASDPANLESAKPAAAALVRACRDWAAAWSALKQLLVTSGSEAFGDDPDTPWLVRVEETLGRWLSGLPLLNDWCAWRAARNAATADGLADLVTRYERGEIQRSQLGHCFERGFGEVWFITVANAAPAIRQFNAASHAQTIDRFRRIDQLLIARTPQAIASRLAANLPLSGKQVSAQSEIGILRRELEKKRRHLPTRRLIEAIPNLLSRLKPCFLMSPLSVAQYLDPKLPPFDLVVFDEASQIPVWDSIGAIARGAEVIVVGDSKQLPPTSFFDTIDTPEESEAEDLAVEDMESILQECNASQIPPMYLRWHYRSRHESLIAFSNHHYYQNGLHTFPSPQDRSPELGVSFRHVPDGIYDRGASRTNRREAERVVEEVVRLLGAGDSPDSIGIVTFNQAQQSLIEDLLDAKRREIPGIERFFTAEVAEPVFVKNLENVQGDERDTIIFSIGYGPDGSGRPSMNFGPINQEGGERRLNVAITRARRRLRVFSSLRSEQIDLKRTRSLGVRHFKTFLDYAERGPCAIAEVMETARSGDFDSGFERTVAGALAERGLEADTQVGSAAYRIDFAVRDAERPGRYVLGIECDGAAYHSGKTARDRDRLRQAVLEGLGWRIERIWSTEWRMNTEGCIERIMSAVEQARLAAASADESPGEPSQEAPAAGMTDPPPTPAETPAMETAAADDAHFPAAAGDGPPVYQVATPPRPNLGRLDLLDPSTTAVAAEALARIIAEEGPIVDELALRRLASWFGVSRLTGRYRTRYQQIRAQALHALPIASDGDALWPHNLEPANFDAFRIPGKDASTRRDIEHIPLVERTNAVFHTLAEQFSLPPDELERTVARRLGLGRLTERTRKPIAEAIELLIARGWAAEREGKVCLLQPS